MPSALSEYSESKGFTLIELLVVIAIIAILSVVGIAAFKGVTGGARDSTRRADIDAIAKAYEIQKTSGYIALSDSQFASGKKPQDPNSQKGDYFNWLATDGSGFKVCASLDNNPNTVCNTPAFNCYCKFSSQGSLNPSSPVNQGASTNYTFGLGGSSQQSCDPNGTLYAGLIGYWKMDEIASPFLDYSGNSNSGVWSGGVSSVAGKFSKAGSFNGTDALVNLGNGTSVNFGTGPITLSAWIYLSSLPSQVSAYPAIIGNYGNNGGYILTTMGTNASNKIGFFLRQDGSTFNAISSNAAPSLNTWHHIVGLRGTDNVMKMYVDNVEQNSTVVYPNNFYPSTNLYLGYYGQYFAGLIDDVRIYNRALSTNEIISLYSSGNGCIL